MRLVDGTLHVLLAELNKEYPDLRLGIITGYEVKHKKDTNEKVLWVQTSLCRVSFITARTIDPVVFKRQFIMEYLKAVWLTIEIHRKQIALLEKVLQHDPQSTG